MATTQAKELVKQILALTPLTFENLGNLIISVDGKPDQFKNKSSYRCHCGEAILRIVMNDDSIVCIHMHRNTNQIDIQEFTNINLVDDRLFKH